MKKIDIYCYDRCTTCKKAIKFMQEMQEKQLDANIDLEIKDIITEKPTKKMIIKYIEKLSGKEMKEFQKQDLKKFFNTSGILYRENKISEKFSDEKVSVSELLDILVSDGKMLKRPLTIIKEVNKNKENTKEVEEKEEIIEVLTGFKEEKYMEILQK